MCGWVQVITRTSNNGGTVDVEIDLPPFAGNPDSPMCHFGYLPTLFDAPANPDHPNGRWLAESFLVSVDVRRLRIDPVAALACGGSVPRCAVFTGHATRVPGEGIWVAFTVAGGGSYYLWPAQWDGDGRWRLTVELGNRLGSGQPYVLTFFYLSDDVGKWLASGRTDAGARPRYDALPPAAEMPESVTVVRRQEPNDGSCAK
jgi:hypothetical protein